MSDTHRLGELQLAIMGRLWKDGEATVADVHAALFPERGLALTTIATMLRKMEQKGVVTHRVEGRQFVYRSLVEERDVHRSMVGDLVARLFDGDAASLVAHLVKEGDVDPKELAALQERIARRRPARRDDERTESER